MKKIKIYFGIGPESNLLFFEEPDKNGDPVMNSEYVMAADSDGLFDFDDLNFYLRINAIGGNHAH